MTSFCCRWAAGECQARLGLTFSSCQRKAVACHCQRFGAKSLPCSFVLHASEHASRRAVVAVPSSIQWNVKSAAAQDGRGRAMGYRSTMSAS